MKKMGYSIFIIYMLLIHSVTLMSFRKENMANTSKKSESIILPLKENVEHCVACKFIWENINEALTDGASTQSFISNDIINKISSEKKSNPLLISQSFQYLCEISPEIFFDSCNIMFDKLFVMTQDFITGMNHVELCIKNELCK